MFQRSLVFFLLIKRPVGETGRAVLGRSSRVRQRSVRAATSASWRDRCLWRPSQPGRGWEGPKKIFTIREGEKIVLNKGIGADIVCLTNVNHGSQENSEDGKKGLPLGDDPSLGTFPRSLPVGTPESSRGCERWKDDESRGGETAKAD